jgi:hypothetical protein
MSVVRRQLQPLPGYGIIDKFYEEPEEIMMNYGVGQEPQDDNITIDNWPDRLPRANRVTDKQNPQKDENIKVELGSKLYGKPVKTGEFDQTGTTPKGQNYTVQAPTMKNADKGFTGTLTEGQKALVEQIKANRESADYSKMRLQMYEGKYGWTYSGKVSEDATPTALKPPEPTAEGEGPTPDPKQTQNREVQKAVWEELAHEGSTGSINAYDSQMVTLGRGLGGKGGLKNTMAELMKDPAMKEAFQKIGISYDRDWLAVNTLTGAVETGTNALAIMQTDPRILSVMSDIVERPENRQKVADANLVGIRATGTMNVPAYAMGWPKGSIQLVAHIHHWGTKYGWGSGAYQDTGGDPLKIVLGFVKVMAEKENANGSYSVRGSGPDTINNFRKWGGGVGFQAIKANFGQLMLTDKEIETSEGVAKSYIIASGGLDPKTNQRPCYIYTG